MKNFQYLLLIATIIGFATAGDVHRVAGALYNSAQADENTQLTLFFALDSGLSVGGTLVLNLDKLPARKASVGTQVHAYPLKGSLDPSTFQEADAVVGAVAVTTVSFASDLAANTPYALVLTGAGQGKGVWGPIGLATYAGGSGANAVVVDQNHLFDVTTVLAAPTAGLTLTVAKDTADETNNAKAMNDGAVVNFNFQWQITNGDLQPSNHATSPWYVKQPWELDTVMGNPAGNTLATQQWSWDVATKCENTQYGKTNATQGATQPKLDADKVKCEVKDNDELVMPMVQDLSYDAAWSEFVIKYLIALKLPTTYAGSQTPTFDTYILKDGNVVLKASTPATCTTCAVALGSTSADSATVEVSWGLQLTTDDKLRGASLYTSTKCIAASSFSISAADTAVNCGLVKTGNHFRSTNNINTLWFQWEMDKNVPDDGTHAEISCKLASEAAYLRPLQASAQFSGWGTGDCYYAGLGADSKTPLFNCVNVGALAKQSKHTLSFQMYVTPGGKTWESASGVTTGFETGFSCQASVKTATGSATWYQATATVTSVDGGNTVNKYESWLMSGDGESVVVPTGTGNKMSTAQTTEKLSLEVVTTAVETKDVLASTVAANLRACPFPASITNDQKLQISVYGTGTYDSTATIAHTMSGTSPVNFLTLTGADGWSSTAAPALDATASTGGYLAFTSSDVTGWCMATAVTVCQTNNRFYQYKQDATNEKYQVGGAVKWTVTGAFNNPQYVTTIRGRGDYVSGSYAKSNQALNDYFVKVTMNASGSGAATWGMSTLSHVLLTGGTELTLAATPGATASDAQVSVGFPVWLDSWNSASMTAVDGTLLTNVVKVYNKAQQTPTQFVGFFLPACTPFFSGGHNQVQVVGTATGAQCWVYGTLNGEGNLEDITPGTAQTEGGLTIDDFGFPNSQPYLMYMGLNLLVCDLTSSTDANTLVVPVKRLSTEQVSSALLVQNAANGGYAVPTGKVSEFASLVLFASVQATADTHNAVFTSNKGMGYYMVIGSDKYLNKITQYARGFWTASTLETVASKNAKKDSADAITYGSAVSQPASPTTANAHFDVLPEPADTASALVGTTFEAKMRTVSTKSTDWVQGKSLNTLCGSTASQVGHLGTVYWDTANKATTTCLKFDYTVGAVGSQTTMRCYYCNGGSDQTNNNLYFSAFASPTYTDRKVQGLRYLVSDQDGAMSNVAPTLASVTLLKVKAVTACTGPTTLKKLIKGQRFSLTITTQNTVPGGAVLTWVNNGVDSNTKQWLGTVGTNSGTVTCGSNSHPVTPTVDGVAFKAALPAGTAGVPACPAGQITLQVDQWSSTNNADDYTFTFVCMVCADSSCTNQQTLTNVDTDTTYAAVSADASGKQALDQSGTGTTYYCGLTGNKQEPNLSGAMGTFVFTPTLPGVKLFAGQSVAVFNFGSGATFDSTNSVCKVKTSGGKPSYSLSSCQVSSGSVSLTWAKTLTAVDFSVKVLRTAPWTASATDLQCSLQQFGVQNVLQQNSDANAKITMPAAGAYSGSASVVTVAKKFLNTMDVGMTTFTVTLKQVDHWGADGVMSVSLPSYYQPRLGGINQCTLWTETTANGVTTPNFVEQLYCEFVEDWNLKVWGPQTASNAQVKPATGDFVVKVMVTGMAMNAQATAQKFQVLTTGTKVVNTTADGKTTSENVVTTEYGLVDDSMTGGSAIADSQSPLELQAVTSSGKTSRSTTTLTVKFRTPDVAENENKMDFVGVELPWGWGNVKEFGLSAVTATLQSSKLNTTSNTAVTGTVTLEKVDLCSLSTRAMKFLVAKTTGANNAETQVYLEKQVNYTLTLANVPTPVTDAGQYGQVKVTVGQYSSGSLATSYAQALTKEQQLPPTQFGFGTLAELNFVTGLVTVPQGTYGGQVCVKATKGNFFAPVALEVEGENFKLLPETIKAEQGKDQACALLGTGNSTQDSVHGVGFKKVENGTAVYTVLPKLAVKVSKEVQPVSVPSSVNCAKNASSDPIVVSTNVVPWGTLSVSLAAKPKAANAAADAAEPSAGVVQFGETVELNAAKLQGFIYLQCNNTTTAATVLVHLNGTSSKQYSVSHSEMTVNFVDKAPFNNESVAGPSTQDASSTPGDLVVSTKCPTVGTAYVQVTAPLNAGNHSLCTDPASCAKAVVDFKKLQADQKEEPENEWALMQWEAVAVSTANTAFKVGPFVSKSQAVQSVRTTCVDNSGNFYQEANWTNVTSPSNGGEVVVLGYTLNSVVKDCTPEGNKIVLDMACAVAQNLAVQKNLVTDQYGGFCGQPSTVLPATCSRRMLQNTSNDSNSSNSSNNTPTTSSVNLYVNPDPRATVGLKASDVTSKASALTDAVNTALAASNVTASAPTVAASSAVQVQPEWNGTVTATGASSGELTLSGGIKTSGVVYCMVQKNGTSTPLNNRILQSGDNSSNDSNSTVDPWAEKQHWTLAQWSADWNVQKQQASSPDYNFQLKQVNMTVAKYYDWVCIATSDSVVFSQAQFRTPMVRGNTQVPAPPAPQPESEKIIVSSIFTALFMLIAAFYY